MAADLVFLPKAKVLSIEEMAFIARAFVELGVEKIRLTGGEPLVRRELVDIVEHANSLRDEGLQRISMTTNGVPSAACAMMTGTKCSQAPISISWRGVNPITE